MSDEKNIEQFDGKFSLKSVRDEAKPKPLAIIPPAKEIKQSDKKKKKG